MHRGDLAGDRHLKMEAPESEASHAEGVAIGGREGRLSNALRSRTVQ